MERILRISIVAAVVMASGCNGDQGESRAGRLEGGIQKGPFILGSQVSLAELDVSLQPTGALFTTQTLSDQGNFVFAQLSQAIYEAQSQGFYFNEATASLSQGSLTLRAFVDTRESQTAFVNVITHLTHERVRTLMLAGETLESAAAQAEQELVVALRMTAPSFVLPLRGTDLNLLGGDTDANAYLFAVSAVMAHAALQQDAAAPDAELQRLLNEAALDLRDGALESEVTEKIRVALEDISPENTIAAFQRYLVRIGSPELAPDFRRIIDQDRDGTPEAQDSCPGLSNPDQANEDLDSQGDACDDCPQTACDDLCVTTAAGDVCGVTGSCSPALHDCPDAQNCYPRLDADTDGDGFLDEVVDGVCSVVALCPGVGDCADVQPPDECIEGNVTRFFSECKVGGCASSIAETLPCVRGVAECVVETERGECRFLDAEAALIGRWTLRGIAEGFSDVDFDVELQAGGVATYSAQRASCGTQPCARCVSLSDVSEDAGRCTWMTTWSVDSTPEGFFLRDQIWRTGCTNPSFSLPVEQIDGTEGASPCYRMARAGN